jgi:FRG domain
MGEATRCFASQSIGTWEKFNEAVSEVTALRPSKVRPWLFRGQADDYPLMTTIERALVGWGMPLTQATTIEFQTIREFRRRLRDPEYYRVQDDTLYCLALMQHHGAPTRLLDCTYSPFVAAAFALENGIFRPNGTRTRPVVWCFNGTWCEDEAKRKLPLDKLTLIGRRNKDTRRNDQTFIHLYQLKTSRIAAPPRWQFVKNENPFHLNERLTTQQGAFLCPADLQSTFLHNLTEMDGWTEKQNLWKLYLDLD